MRFKRSAVSIALAMLVTCLAAYTQTTATKAKTTVVIAGRLFDGVSDHFANNQAVVIEGDHITKVGDRDQIPIPAEATVIDLSNRVVLPGLIDAHTHMLLHPGDEKHPYRDQFLKESWQYRTLYGAINAKKDLESGVTSARDLGTDGAMYSDVDIRNAINDGLIPGPRLQVATRALVGTTCCFIIEGYSPEATVPTAAQEVDSPDAARHVVREQIKYGADVIKIFATRRWFLTPSGQLKAVPTLTLEETEAIVNEAHRQFEKVACHAYAGDGLHYCIEAGVDSIEHGIDVDDASAEEMAKKGIFYVPTLDVYNLPSMEASIEDPGSRRHALQEASFHRAMKHGVKIVLGTDVGPLPHGTIASEFEYFVKFGMRPLEALKAGTSLAAQLMGWEDRVGTVSPGKYADLVALDGDPLRDITQLERIKFVMKGGEIVRNDWAASPSPSNK